MVKNISTPIAQYGLVVVRLALNKVLRYRYSQRALIANQSVQRYDSSRRHKISIHEHRTTF